MVGAFYIPGDFGKWATCAIFAIAAITDYFDGYLARSWSMQSRLGRMLDPIADKLLVGAAILMLVHFDRVADPAGAGDPVPRDPGLGPARVPGRGAGRPAGLAARQVEDRPCR